MTLNFGKFIIIIRDFRSFFNTVIRELLSIEARCLMIRQCICLLRNWWNRLNESYHRAITFRVETPIVTWMNINKGEKLVMQWIFCQRRFSIIPKIGQKSESIVKFNLQSLIIDCTPLSLNFFSSTALAFAFAKLSDSFIIIFKANFYQVFLCELEFIVFINDLYAIWQIVGANVFWFEQVY